MSDDHRYRMQAWRRKFDRLVRDEERQERERKLDIDLLVRRQAVNNPLCRRFL